MIVSPVVGLLRAVWCGLGATAENLGGDGADATGGDDAGGDQSGTGDAVWAHG